MAPGDFLGGLRAWDVVHGCDCMDGLRAWDAWCFRSPRWMRLHGMYTWPTGIENCSHATELGPYCGRSRSSSHLMPWTPSKRMWPNFRIFTKLRPIGIYSDAGDAGTQKGISLDAFAAAMRHWKRAMLEIAGQMRRLFGPTGFRAQRAVFFAGNDESVAPPSVGLPCRESRTA